MGVQERHRHRSERPAELPGGGAGGPGGSSVRYRQSTPTPASEGHARPASTDPRAGELLVRSRVGRDALDAVRRDGEVEELRGRESGARPDRPHQGGADPGLPGPRADDERHVAEPGAVRGPDAEGEAGVQVPELLGVELAPARLYIAALRRRGL